MSNIDRGAALEDLVNTLGQKQTIELIELALPAVENWKVRFAEPLLHNDNALAATYAHKALGSVRLYGTPYLEGLLTKIRDLKFDGEKLAPVLIDVSNEFHSTHEVLKNWLVTQRA